MQIAKFLIPSIHPFHLVVNQGSVTKFQHEKGAIVNAANECCLGGGGVDGAISAAGGQRLLRDRILLPEVYQNVRCPVGEAKMTGPGNYGKLNVNYVIHAVGPSYWDYDDTREADELLKSAYGQSLQRAQEAELEQLAFSLLSAGVFRGSQSLMAVLQIAIETISQYEGYEQLKEVHLFAFNKREVLTILQVTRSLGMTPTE
jgi:O-acetyl-ADP-ribose deacetylase (regulator of RNase III)